MERTLATALLWTPRLAGIALSLFLAAFALDAFSQERSLLAALADFALHLVPSFALAAVVAAAWHRPWVGAVCFIGAGVVYSLQVQRLDWILVIALPLWTVGLLFLFSWWCPAPARG